MLTPELTYTALLIVQTLHLLHHRIVKRHISFAEVASSAALCVPPTVAIPAVLLIAAHLALIAIQVIGSVWIRKLSPTWAAAATDPHAS